MVMNAEKDLDLERGVSQFKRLKIPLNSESSISLFSSAKDLFDLSQKKIINIFKNIRKSKKRSGRGNVRRKKVNTFTTGRKFQVVSYKGDNMAVAVMPTIMDAIYSNHYNLKEKRFYIKYENFKAWKRVENESLSLILIADVSQSTYYFIKAFTPIFKSLTSYFKQNNDRVGLIAMNGEQSQILNYPTNNFQVVTKSLMQLKISGYSPLANAMQRGFDMVKLEKQKNPSSKPLVVLVSDCSPEPLVGGYPDIMDEPAYQDAIHMATLYKLNHVPLLTINPSWYSEEEVYPEGKYPFEKLTNLITEKSGGSLLKFQLYTKGMPNFESSVSKLSAKQIDSIFDEISEIYNS